jgi:hypothetical protein
MVVLAVGLLCTYATGTVANERLRADLLMKTNIAAAGLDRGDIMKLKGTADDLETELYLLNKQRMMRIRSAATGSGFAYLMGIRGEEIFFFADSEPEDSEDYSPPGQVYDEASPELIQSFRDGLAFVEGPTKDRWGTWVSGLVPIRDPDSGKMIAVFGIDMDAARWRGELWSRQMVPLFIMLFGLLYLVGFYSYRDHHRSLLQKMKDRVV